MKPSVELLGVVLKNKEKLPMKLSLLPTTLLFTATPISVDRFNDLKCDIVDSSLTNKLSVNTG